MFEQLKLFKKIIVTGAQRSGTTICAQMIAHDLRLRYVDENEVGIADWVKIRRLVDSNQEFVLQCPQLSSKCHEYASNDVAIVFMLRDIEDIVKSENRINWGGYRRDELRITGHKHGIVSYIKRRLWFKKQKRFIPHAFEIVYESLSAHPFWVPKDKRTNQVGRDTFVKDINAWLEL